MKTAKEISDYYDQYTNKQQKMWHNERHYFLLNQLKNAEVKKSDTILEIGCGIGTMTNLIAPIIKKGKLISTDISPKSIEFAKENNKYYENIEFIVADAVEFNLPQINYNFILLFDVLEHIQNEARENCIKNIASIMNDETKFLMNVPAPRAHMHAIENFPDLMQIVEIPVWIDELIPLFKKYGLEIKSFFTYDMWQKEEYQFYIIEKVKAYTYTKTKTDPNLNPQSLVRRINRKVKKIQGK